MTTPPPTTRPCSSPPPTRPSLWPYLSFCVHLIRYEYQSCLSVCMCTCFCLRLLIFDYVSISDCCDDATFLNVYQKVNVSSLYLYISIFVSVSLYISILYLYICISISVCLYICMPKYLVYLHIFIYLYVTIS